jgi:chorismate synthase
MLRFLTCGESHGQALIAVLDGFPAGLKIDVELLNKEMEARQKGFGRSHRQQIEIDRVEFISGVRHGITNGAPISLLVRNRDFENWRDLMSALPVDEASEALKKAAAEHKISGFRPGHADLAGTLKFRQQDVRDVLERASARETAARVAAGAICLQFLQALGISLVGHVVAVGSAVSRLDSESLSMDELAARLASSEIFCADQPLEQSMKDYIKRAGEDGDTAGGVVEVIAEGVPVGLGSYTQWDERLDGQLAQALMSIQAIKAVEIGEGVKGAELPGSQVHDALYPAADSRSLPFSRKTNHAGGVEGGMSNGARLRLRAYMKPIPTLRKPLPSLSFPDYETLAAHYERSDVCAVPAAAVVAKTMVGLVLTRSILQKFGSDNFMEISESLARHRQWCSRQGAGRQSEGSSDPARSQTQME